MRIKFVMYIPIENSRLKSEANHDENLRFFLLFSYFVRCNRSSCTCHQGEWALKIGRVVSKLYIDYVTVSKK